MTRKTYHYDPVSKQMVEGPGPRRVDGSGDGWRFSDRLYSGTPFKAHDGTIIDSKKKHAEYMKRHSLTTADDFTGEWEQARKRREAVYTGQHDKERRREEVARAIHILEQRERRS
jgi:hypothetical protein